MNTKIILSLFLFLFALITAFAQTKGNCFNLEFNALRYGPNLGILRRRHYENEFTMYNGFNLGYKLTKQTSLFLGVRRLKNNTGTYYKEGNYENIKTWGVEITNGVEYIIQPSKPLYLSYMVGVYLEYASHQGRVGRSGAFLDIDHIRHVIGFAGKIQLNYQPFKRLEYFINSRLNYGYSVIKRKKGLTEFGTWGDSEYWNTILEPLGGIGVRLLL